MFIRIFKALMQSIKSIRAKRQRAAGIKKAVHSIIAILRAHRSDTGFSLPLSRTRFLDYGGEYRTVYRLGDYIIDTFVTGARELVAVGHIGDGIDENGFIGGDFESKAIIAYADYSFYADAKDHVFDLRFDTDKVEAFSNALLLALFDHIQAQPKESASLDGQCLDQGANQ